MDFTREPIIETVITPKDGCTLVVRSSKNSGQEEYFVDAIEVVSFGNSFFFRSRERPKSFLVPVSDYELLEVRETRLVLKNVGFDRSIKIAGGREASRPARETTQEKAGPAAAESKEPQQHAESPTQAAESSDKSEVRLDKKRERRRNYKRKREEQQAKEAESSLAGASEEDSSRVKLPKPTDLGSELEGSEALPGVVTSVLSSLLPPPVNLISETIARYKDNALFKGVFFVKDEDKENENAESSVKEESSHLEALQTDDEEITLPTISLDQPKYGSFEVSEEEEEAIYQQRRSMREAAQQKVAATDNEPQHYEQQDNERQETEIAATTEQSVEQIFPREAEAGEATEALPLSFSAEEESNAQSDNSEPYEQHTHNHTVTEDNP